MIVFFLILDIIGSTIATTVLVPDYMIVKRMYIDMGTIAEEIRQLHKILIDAGTTK